VRAFLATLAILAMACYEFALVGPEPDLQPRLFLHAAAVHDELLVYMASGVLIAGTDSEGRPRQLSDSSMQVQDQVIQPRINHEALSYQWSDTLTATDISPEWISIRTPALLDQPTSSRLISIPLTTRADPFNVDLPTGENLRLGVSAPTIPATGLIARSSQWQLQLRKREVGASFLSVQGQEFVGRDLTVPWTWLEQNVAPGDTIIATLYVFGDYDPPGVPFSIDIGAFSRLVWQVRIVASAPSP
jgi:hypothetical protein